MKKGIPSELQNGTGMGGSLNLIPFNYKISETPIGDETKYGYLAFVTDKTRKKIMESGFGEMQMHIERIKKSVGYIKKMRKRSPAMQLAMDLGE